MSLEDGYHLCWRLANVADLTTINRIGDEIHVDLPERPEVFEEKFRLFPRGCLVLCQSETIVGYGFSHPWCLYSVPPLDTFLGRLPSFADCMFIHDVVVLAVARGHGAAGEFVERTVAVAREQGMSSLALVSVYNTHPLWARCGFEVVLDLRLKEKLKSYGQSARYMIRRLP